MIVKTSIKGNGIKCDCCNKRFTDKIMRHYEIGAFKNFTLCKQCERQLYKISGGGLSKSFYLALAAAGVFIIGVFDGQIKLK